MPHSLEDPNSGALLLHVGLQTFAAAISLPASVAIVMLLVWHVRMVATNKTTIEHAEGVTALIKAGVSGAERQRHPYDLGLADNLHDILGPRPELWCLPTCTPTPGGLSYRTGYAARGGGGVADFFAF